MDIEENNKSDLVDDPSLKDYLKFILPSLLGILLFIVPVRTEEGVTLPVALVANWVVDRAGDVLPLVTMFLLCFAAIFTIITKWIKPRWILDHRFYGGLFNVGYFWIVARVLGALFAVMTYWQLGPEMIWSKDTGGVAFFDLASLLVVIFLFAGLFLPLLLDFGLLELCGTLMSKIMRPVFTIPGRSAIDCVASWVGDGTIGVLLTSKQYEAGFYTKREAAVIGTTFSFVSITFTIVVIDYIGLIHLFFQAYIALTVAGLSAALIMPRIPPLSWKPNTFYESVQGEPRDIAPEAMSLWRWGIVLATARAGKVKGVLPVVKRGVQNVFDMWFGVVPVVVMLATLANICVVYTPIFSYLGAPFVILLEWLRVPEAGEAGQTMVVGFADMLLPVVVAKEVVTDEFTKFVIATVSCTQLVYMSEIGALLLSSKVPVRFWELVVIFLERTLITLPIVVLMAHVLL
ncbi:YjiH family protein [Poriferisphaera sp. WC338]|uniref:YjiH family protein n=1 Tax=Poriferisphaera sp. WC338 TaxID=3425129 RepID=UPI003D817AA7